MLIASAPAFSAPIAQALPIQGPPRFARRILVSAVGLGVLAEILFDGHAWGISFPLFTAMSLAVLLWTGNRECRQQARPNLWLAVPLLFFAAMVAVLDNALLTALNAIASLGLFLLLTHAYTGGNLTDDTVPGYLASAARALGSWFGKPPQLIRSAVDVSSVKAWSGTWGKPLLRGVLLALPVTGVFAVLLGAADLRFERLIDRVLSVSAADAAGHSLKAIALLASTAFLSAGALAHSLRRRESWATTVRPSRAPSGLGFIEGSILLICVDVLFTLFVAIQFAYLFGGNARLAEADLTYASYARRGFFELLAVAVLSLALILVLNRFVSRSKPGERTSFNVLCTAMVSCVVVILASAIMRMSLYEQAYGYTRLRVYTHVFMFTLIPLLGWRAVTLWTRIDRFAVGLLGAAILCVAALNVLNPDEFIVRRDLERGQADVEYLTSLSSDALPALVAALQSGQLGAQEAPLRDAIREAEASSRSLVPSSDDLSWPELHWGKMRARRALAELCHTGSQQPETAQ